MRVSTYIDTHPNLVAHTFLKLKFSKQKLFSTTYFTFSFLRYHTLPPRKVSLITRWVRFKSILLFKLGKLGTPSLVLTAFYHTGEARAQGWGVREKELRGRALT